MTPFCDKDSMLSQPLDDRRSKDYQPSDRHDKNPMRPRSVQVSLKSQTLILQSKMSATQDEDKNSGDEVASIILKVKSQDGDEVFYRIRVNTQLKRLMYAYCDRRGLEFNAFCFFFDGRRLPRGVETPEELDMKDGDEIYALRPMGGGLRADQRQWAYMLFDHSQFR